MSSIKIFNDLITEHCYRRRGVIFLTLLYSALIIFLSYFHVVWRDEVRALSIVIDSKSILQLFKNLHNEGHPFLWYIILWAGFQLTHSMAILKIASVLIAIGAVYFFLLKAPFSLAQKALFIFGFFPAYEYSVICRGYGLSMALLFLACFLYSKRFTQSVLFGVVLFLLANTEAYALIITIAIFLSLIAEFIWKRKDLFKDRNIRNKIVIGFTITALGIVCSVLLAYPDRTTYFNGAYAWNMDAILKNFLYVAVFAGDFFKEGLGIPWVPAFIIVWLFYVYLVRDLFLLSICFISITGIAMFGHLVYFLRPWHQGYLYFLMIAGFWIEIERENHNKETLNAVNEGIMFLSKSKHVFLYVLLIAQLVMGYHAISRELKVPYSSSKSFGVLLDRHPEFKDAIILGEPDYFMESIPYYVTNEIYFPREGRFGKISKFTKAKRWSYSLKEMLETAQELKGKYRRPVLIAMAHRLDIKGPFLRNDFGTNFSYSEEQLRDFLNNTSKVSVFRGPTGYDEEYDVYSLK